MDALFYSSYLLFSDENIDRIKNAKVGVVGMGGIGGITLEMLARAGVGQFSIADLDVYSEMNLNRQLFSTVYTLGRNKAVVAKERILSINPECKIKVYDEGVNLRNYKEFCDEIDILAVENDTESVKVLIHKYAKEKGIPVVMGSRVSLDSATRWSVRAKLWDYKNNPDLPTFGSTNHPELDKYSLEELTDEMLKEYDAGIKQKKINLFNSYDEDGKNYFLSISNRELKKKLNSVPDGYNRHVCSVIANTAGCLAATSTLRYIIGMPKEEIRVDLM